ncbi:hypothetical protein TRV_04850 [Trichophyton verrucosum HKI 0517]|uniref:Uncharacterized protein n=1 Tax=Trichophyton verrucosum (strain HKI 0517) TaxID=663202 RepID=D4DCJ5_TRIVH|nr:uncharacterized protein TRV_04850 [Trichophyton verrucosum HKI 0517]EFE40367.1 hypothetical protein TRV_04850 [Trichophyton verrucosum HKI 0517]
MKQKKRREDEEDEEEEETRQEPSLLFLLRCCFTASQSFAAVAMGIINKGSYYYEIIIIEGLKKTVDQPAPFRLFFPPWPFKERSSSSSPTSSSSSSPLLLVSIVLLAVRNSPSALHGFFSSSRPKLDRPTNQRRPAPTAPGPQPRLPTSSLLQAFSFDYNTLTHAEKNHADDGGSVSSGRSGRRPGVGTGWLSASAGFETGDAARMQLTARFFLCLTCRDAIILVVAHTTAVLLFIWPGWMGVCTSVPPWPSLVQRGTAPFCGLAGMCAHDEDTRDTITTYS